MIRGYAWLWAVGVCLLATSQASWAQSAPRLSDLTVAVEGSPWRLVKGDSEGTPELKLLLTRADCRSAMPLGEEMPEEMLEACLPRANRDGSLRLSVQIRDDAGPLPMVLDDERLEVRVDTHTQVEGNEPVPIGRAVVDVKGHVKGTARQLNILVLDRSGSMYNAQPDGTRRATELAAALNHESVVRAFFPKPAEGRTDRVQARVAILSVGCRIGGTAVCGVDASGREVANVMATPLLTTAEEYRNALGVLSYATSAFTPLYDGVRAAYDLSRLPGTNEEGTSVGAFLARGGVEPSVIVLSDGFNNTYSAQRCGANAEPLAQLANALGAWRRRRPTFPVLNAVGFGTPRFDGVGLQQARSRRMSISKAWLCEEALNDRIDGSLDAFLDNRSLTMLAAVGGGKYVNASNQSELVRAFASRKRTSHYWYSVDVHDLPLAARRRPFEVLLSVPRPFDTQARVVVYPHGMLGAAPGSTGLRDLLALPMLLLSWLGLCLVGFRSAPNAYRALFRQPELDGAGRAT